MKKEITIWRTHGTPTETMGYMEINGKFFGYTLEDPIREKKLYGDTCIPFGKYKVKNTESSKFKRVMPLIYNTGALVVLAANGDSWSGIRIHGGNTHKDTLGCPIIAKTQGINKPRRFGNEVFNNWVQGSLERELTKLIGDEVWELHIRHIDEQEKKTLLRVRNPLMKSDAILAVQKALVQKGYQPGKVDGIYGTKTEEAVKLFQSKNGLTNDGIVGPKTLSKLLL